MDKNYIRKEGHCRLGVPERRFYDGDQLMRHLLERRAQNWGRKVEQ